MPINITMPALSPTMEEGTLAKWLVKEGDKLKIVTTGNAETPLTKGQTALLTCDVWEHAYYIDFRNLRAKYVSTFMEKLVNWDFAAANFK
jgi:Fe-Mn family superoxide dismutase